MTTPTDPKKDQATIDAQAAAAAAAAGASAAVNAVAGDGDGGSDTGNQRTGPTEPIMDAEEAAGDALTLFTVLIDRDANTRIPAQMRGFEIPIVLEIYGEDRVFVVGEEDLDDADDFDVAKHYDGLRTKYSHYESQMRTVYASQRAFEKAVGIKATGNTTPAKDRQSMQISRPIGNKAAKTAAKSATKTK